jgi:hypothetical protein
MILNLRIEDQSYPVEVPQDILQTADGFFDQLNQDMDRGWQMSRFWVENPNVEQRCQIVADRILGAFEHENKKSLLLYAAYILKHLPEVKTVDISTTGEMQETIFEFE